MIDAFANFHFIRPFWLILAPLALLFWRVLQRRGDTTLRWRAAIDPELLKHLTVDADDRKRLNPENVLLIAWLIGVLALAGPTWRREPSPFADAAPPAMIVLRAAPSMLATDLPPTRLERARQKIADLLSLREGAAAGLIAYSGSTHLVLPPTPDKDVVIAMAQAISPTIMPREGDRLADAVAQATQVLVDGGRGGAIVVIADTVAPDQVDALRVWAGASRRPPSVVLALAAPDQDDADPSLRAAASAMDAPMIAMSIDQSDIQSLARRIDFLGQAANVAGEGERWRDAGYWLTPLIALLTLGWFRRGWLLAR